MFGNNGYSYSPAPTSDPEQGQEHPSFAPPPGPPPGQQHPSFAPPPGPPPSQQAKSSSPFGDQYAQSQQPQQQPLYYGAAPGGHYPQPPPSYQYETPDGGVPRSEYDNVPDDFKFGGRVAEGTLSIRMAFIRKVYTILFAQFLLTGLVSSISFFSEGYRTFVQTHAWIVLVTALSAIVFMFLTFWKRNSYPANLLFLGGFTLLEAYSVSVVISFYSAIIVLEAVVITMGLFAGLTLFACQSKYDFRNWQSYLGFSLWALIIFSFMGMFFPYNNTFELVYSGVVALVFCGYILVDTQSIMRHYHVDEEIAAAMALYLDILNLFLAILRILGASSDD